METKSRKSQPSRCGRFPADSYDLSPSRFLIVFQHKEPQTAGAFCLQDDRLAWRQAIESGAERFDARDALTAYCVNDVAFSRLFTEVWAWTGECRHKHAVFVAESQGLA